jgi:GNAT superfamily N-acetyltransferase
MTNEQTRFSSLFFFHTHTTSHYPKKKKKMAMSFPLHWVRRWLGDTPASADADKETAPAIAAATDSVEIKVPCIVLGFDLPKGMPLPQHVLVHQKGSERVCVDDNNNPMIRESFVENSLEQCSTAIMMFRIDPFTGVTAANALALQKELRANGSSPKLSAFVDALLGFALCKEVQQAEPELVTREMWAPTHYVDLKLICARRGYGSKLLTHVERLAFTVLNVPLLLDAVVAAIPFYRARGFRFSRTVDAYPTESPYLVKKWDALVAASNGGRINTNTNSFKRYLGPELLRSNTFENEELYPMMKVAQRTAPPATSEASKRSANTQAPGAADALRSRAEAHYDDDEDEDALKNYQDETHRVGIHVLSEEYVTPDNEDF